MNKAEITAYYQPKEGYGPRAQVFKVQYTGSFVADLAPRPFGAAQVWANRVYFPDSQNDLTFNVDGASMVVGRVAAPLPKSNKFANPNKPFG